MTRVNLAQLNFMKNKTLRTQGDWKRNVLEKQQNSTSQVDKLNELPREPAIGTSRSIVPISSQFNSPNSRKILNGRYQILNKIGTGSFSTVYKAVDLTTKNIVAVKEVKIDDQNQIILIERELEVLSMLSKKSRMFVELYDFILDISSGYIVMEFIDGKSLLDFVNEYEGGLPERMACRLFSQIIDGLHYMHTLKICHRDIKAENFIVTHYSHIIKFIDFGLSKVSSNSQNLFSTFCGTPQYCSPEKFASFFNRSDIEKGNFNDAISSKRLEDIQNHDQTYSLSSDIWSAGILLYAMLYGRLPFEHANFNILISTILYQEPFYNNGIVSDCAIDLIKKMLEKDPNYRITIAEIKQHPFVAKYFTGQVSLQIPDHQTISNMTVQRKSSSICRRPLLYNHKNLGIKIRTRERFIVVPQIINNDSPIKDDP